MITFLDYLGEAISTEKLRQVHELIAKDCQPWLSASGGMPVYRGMSNIERAAKRVPNIESKVYHGIVRKDRRPRDSSVWLHNALNEYFIKKTGTPLRTVSLFVAPKQTTTKLYGSVFAIYPKGSFDYAWSPHIADPTMLFNDSNMHHELKGESKKTLALLDKFFKEDGVINVDKSAHFANEQGRYSVALSNQYDNHFERLVKKFIETTDLWEINQGLSTILNDKKYSNHELMINCKDYYAMSTVLARQLKF